MITRFAIAALLLFPTLTTQAQTTVPDMASRVQTCVVCHGAEGRASAEGYYPRIAGKPEGYLHNQLIAFRDGSRQHAAMNGIVQHLSNDYLLQMARYFAALNPPYPSPAKSTATEAELEQGKHLVFNGAPDRKIPACAACHGQALTGIEPYTPGLLGLPRDYLNAQLGKWRNGQRKAAEPDCMHALVKTLTPEELNTATAYLAAQPVPKNPKAAPANSIQFPLKCGTHFTTTIPDSNDVLSEQQKRGAYLARIGNCAGCHTANPKKPFAGGRAIETPFGKIYSTNLTPNSEHGLGSWTADDFYKAMHSGISKNGDYLYPAFPYTDYTKMSRAETNDLFAYLKRLPAIAQKTPQPELQFPFNQRPLLAVWRALYFAEGEYQPNTQQSEQWNRGAYLVNGPGHCAACHTPRNALGGLKEKLNLSGATIPVLNWFAPALNNHPVHGLGKWSETDIAQYLQAGVNRHAATYGPMSEVIAHSLQFATTADTKAMAVYLKSLSAQAPSEKESTGLGQRTLQPLIQRGESIYANTCAECHGKQGEGKANQFPALTGNVNVIAPNPVNAIRMVLNGGFSPSTKGTPYPHGMPPYRVELSNTEIAAVVTYIRRSWGNSASGVASVDVDRLRGKQ
ncbi:c-type cytochrome [Limnobacter sp.]|uniref:c-type cytochrome n=1 Tax=Limnobacter sp. TaxID=2003368 RepID=UPI002FE22F49